MDIFYLLWIKKHKKCPNCGSTRTKKRGIERGLQTWSCQDCKRRFRNERRDNITLQKSLWKEYVFEKQTLRELKFKYQSDRRTLKNHLNNYQAPDKTHFPRAINLIADALYFGERTEKTSWCAVVFRDPLRKENLWWRFSEAETTTIYLEGRYYLESLGYKILSVTGDGFGGLKQGFNGIPYQMCQVHMERLIVNGTTRSPILEAGQALLALAKLLHHTDSKTFNHYLNKYVDKYRDFLNQKTVNPFTGQMSFTHEPLRKAALSLVRYRPYLFTFEQNRNIPKTTNSLEGHFSHMRDIVEIHRGLSRIHKQRVLNSILLASTIAPTKGKLEHIL